MRQLRIIRLSVDYKRTADTSGFLLFFSIRNNVELGEDVECGKVKLYIHTVGERNGEGKMSVGGCDTED